MDDKKVWTCSGAMKRRCRCAEVLDDAGVGGGQPWPPGGAGAFS